MVQQPRNPKCDELRQRLLRITDLIRGDTRKLRTLWARRHQLRKRVSDLRSERQTIIFRLQTPDLSFSTDRDRDSARFRLRANVGQMGAEFAVRNAAELIKVSARRREIDDELEQLRARLESIQRRIEPIDRIRNDSYRGREIIKQEMRDLGCSRPPQLY